MYWKADHYECISCNATMGDTAVISLDQYKVDHFKKITRPDTISQYSIGKLWYLKTDGQFEFFTTSGYHPIYTQRRLLKLSQHVYENRISKAKIDNK